VAAVAAVVLSVEPQELQRAVVVMVLRVMWDQMAPLIQVAVVVVALMSLPYHIAAVQAVQVS
jgi:hypothetical protein